MRALSRQFFEADEGVATTEYLLLLGLLISGIIISILAMSGVLNDVWVSWAEWIASSEGGLSPPT